MISALYESRVSGGGTNKFNKGVMFGWGPIENMLYRAVQRKKKPACKSPRVERELYFQRPMVMVKCKIMQLHSIYFYK